MAASSAGPGSSSTASASAPIGTEALGSSSLSARDGGNGGYPIGGRNGNVSSKQAGTGAGNTTGTEKQYIILKLDKLSILRKMHFGKFYKSHPCNLKDFKVYGNASTRDPHSKAWVRILRGGLKNDAIPEVFDTRWTTAEGVPFPCRYVKLVPLATHLPNYNFSVWYVALEGVSDARIVGQISASFHEHRESVALRLILKHLRSRAYHSAFQVLLESSRLELPIDGSVAPLTGPRRSFEQPIVTQLFHALMQGSWDVVESCLDRAAWSEQARRNPLKGSDDSEGAVGRESVTGNSGAATAASASLLSSYVERATPKPIWSQILATDLHGNSPCGRGGHQMELDSERGILWLFGGWDGTKDLADLWAYHIHEARWRCVSRDVRQQGGPGPRSCHKMVFDPRTGFLYVLGKYVDYDKPPSRHPSPSAAQASADRDPMAAGGGSSSTAARGLFLPRFPGATLADTQSGRADREDGRDELFASNRGGHMRLSPGRGGGPDEPGMPAEQTSESRSHIPAVMTEYESDFYRFSTRSERWDRLSYDTFAEGGPKLLFDHQMLIDPETQLLYVFGGRVAHPDASKMELSGMWKYDVIQRSWTFLFDDNTHPHSRIPSRVGHTMLLDTPKRGSLAGKRILWVLAGQRGTTYLADMWTYQLNTGAVREASRDYSLASNGGGPEGGFTQRATIDADAREIYLFSGLVRRSKSRGERVKSAFWVYNIERHDWRLVYQHGGNGSTLRRDLSEEYDRNEALFNGDGEEEVSTEISEPGRGPTQAFPVLSSDSAEGGGSGDVMMPASDALPISAAASPRPNVVETEPRPRFAAQMVYDYKTRHFYIFGGNPAEGHSPSVRLDDLWSLELVRPSVGAILRKAKFKVRQQRFLEMVHDTDGISAGSAGMGAMQALVYLQTQVSQMVNHDVPEESQAFRKLMAHLLHAGSGTSGGSARQAGSATEAAFDGSSPWMSPTPGGNSTEAESGTVSPPLLRTEDSSATAAITSSTSVDVGAIDAHSDSEGDSEMLSISQVIPSGTPATGAGTGSAMGPTVHVTSGTSANSAPSSSGISTSARQLATEGRPSPLYRQRYNLFRTLSEFFPADAVEPSIDLLDCIEISKLSF